MATGPNTQVTFMSVGTEESWDSITWIIDQAIYLLELVDPPKVLLIDYAW